MFDPVFDEFKAVCTTRPQLEYKDKVYSNFERIATSAVSLDIKKKYVERLINVLLKKTIDFKKTGEFSLEGGKSRRQRRGGKSRRKQTKRRL